LKPEDLHAHCLAVEIDHCDTGNGGLLRLQALANNRTQGYRHALTN